MIHADKVGTKEEHQPLPLLLLLRQPEGDGPEEGDRELVVRGQAARLDGQAGGRTARYQGVHQHLVAVLILIIIHSEQRRQQIIFSK